MRRLSAISSKALAVSLALAGCTQAITYTRPATPAVPAAQAPAEIPTQLPRGVRPAHYAISVAPDPANLRFNGSVLIDLDVAAPTDVITLNAAELEIASASLTDTAGATVRPERISLDAAQQTASFHFEDRIAAGRYRLAIAYSGKINTQAAGLFALDYTAEGGAQKRALFTQFQAPDARRFVPSWDEPAFRTPFDLRVRAPADQMVVSNMPQAGREEHPDGTATIRFQTTPAMSTYLLFLAMGDFDRITKAAAGTEIGVVMKKGDGEKGRMALDGSAQLVPYYNDYFGTPYPLPKLDNIAAPGSSQFFAAMENWGAILSFEAYLLNDPAITTEGQRQAIFGIAAHEIAHQWFGNLVTMAWWDDLWLNEGFASWMGTKATAALHPEWEPLLGRVGGREQAMLLDAVATTHPVIQRISTVDQISQAFDSITYQKGEAVITMLEDYVGEEAWRRGVQDYIRTYRLKNTVTDNLWERIEAAAGKPVTAIAHDFTRQPGVPMIRVERAECVGGATRASLRQTEFAVDRPGKTPLAWRVPVIAATVGGGEVRTLVEGGKAELSVPGCGALIVNAGQTGYYRTLYAPALLDRLTQSYAKLEPVDQIGLLADNWSLGLGGFQRASESLDMVEQAPANANPRLIEEVAGILYAVHAMYDGDPATQDAVRRYASKKLAPALARVGWTPREGEPSNDAVLRDGLIGALGGMGDPAVVAEANRRYAASTRNASALPGSLRSTVLGIVAAKLDAGGWEAMRAQARAETNPLVKQQLYTLLGSVEDEALARRALELALTPEPGATNSSGIIAAVAGGHPDMAFDWAVQNRAAVEALVDLSSRSEFIPALAAGSSNPAMVAKLQDYATRYMTAGSRAPADRAIATIQNRVLIRQERVPDITRWFRERG